MDQPGNGIDEMTDSSATKDQAKSTHLQILQAGEEFQRLFESAPWGIGIADETGKIVALNEAILRQGGYTYEDIARIGNVANLYADTQQRDRMIADLRLGQPVENVEVQLKRKDGTLYNALVTLKPTIYKGQRCIQALVEDITGRKQAEAELRASEERYRRLVELSPEPVAVHSQGKLVYVNQAAVALVGATSAEQLIGTAVMDIIHPDSRELVKERMQQAVTGGKPLSLTREKFMRLDGKLLDVEVTAMPMTFQGQPAAQVIVHDISARIQDETIIHNLLAETERRLRYVLALRDINVAITSSLDLSMTLNLLLDELATQLNVDAADVLLLSPHTQTLSFAAGRGFHTDAVQRAHLRLGEGHAGRAALERQTINVPDLQAEPINIGRASYLSGEGFVAYYGAPLIAKGQVKGILEIFQRAPLSPDEEWINFLETITRQAAIAIDNISLFQELQRSNTELTFAYDDTIKGWSYALDLRDHEAEGHTQRVAELTEQLARRMGVSDVELVYVHRGALLHDIGKMGIPDHILLKPVALSESEWITMRLHPRYAYDILSPIEYLHPALDIPYCHHERWDGTGYPRGLKGSQIPLAARIFAVVDVWDALTSDRPYRKAWSQQEAIDYIRAQSDAQFDPAAVDVFLEVLYDMPNLYS